MNRIKDIPLAELTLRRYEKPYELEKRELLRKFCLSIGLLQPGDSRDVIVDILYVLLESGKRQEHLSSEDIRKRVVKLRESYNIPLVGIAGSNIRRQLKRLRELLIAEKIKNSYRLSEFMKLSSIFEEKIEQYMLPSVVSRVKEYFMAIDREFFGENPGEEESIEYNNEHRKQYQGMS